MTPVTSWHSQQVNCFRGTESQQPHVDSILLLQSHARGQGVVAGTLAPNHSLGAVNSPNLRCSSWASSARSEHALNVSSNPYGSVGSSCGKGGNSQLYSNYNRKMDLVSSSNTATSNSTTAQSCDIDTGGAHDLTQILNKEYQVVTRLPGSAPLL